MKDARFQIQTPSLLAKVVDKLDNAPLEIVTTDLGEFYLTHLAPDPNTPTRLFAADQANEVLISEDGGRSWRRFGT